MRTLVVAAGDLNEAKQLGAVLAAVAELDDDVHLALVGRRIEGFDADAAVAASGLGGRVTLAPDVSDEDFRAWLYAADVVVDLRYPAPRRGERLARARDAGGRPTIVSATGTYLDVSDDAVLRVAAGPTDAHELAGVLRTLAGGHRAARAHGGGRGEGDARARRGRRHRPRLRRGDRADARRWSATRSARRCRAGAGRSPTSGSTRTWSARGTGLPTRRRSRTSRDRHSDSRPVRRGPLLDSATNPLVTDLPKFGRPERTGHSQRDPTHRPHVRGAAPAASPHRASSTATARSC